MESFDAAAVDVVLLGVALGRWTAGPCRSPDTGPASACSSGCSTSVLEGREGCLPGAALLHDGGW